MIIKNLPELVYILNIYKNPYLISNYKGIDWSSYNNYRNNINMFNLSDNLSLISIKKNQYYKIYNKDFISMLEGELLIDYNKRIEQSCSSSYYFYNNTYQNKEFLTLQGLSNYNTFLYYKNYKNLNH